MQVSYRWRITATRDRGGCLVYWKIYWQIYWQVWPNQRSTIRAGYRWAQARVTGYKQACR